MSGFLTRRADFTREQFSDYWTNTHAPLLVSVPEVRKYTIRYVQQHNTGFMPEGLRSAPYDGIIEVWLDNLEALQAIASSENWATVLADVENFADTSKTAYLFTTEEVIYEQ
ncbi:EthD domain-containing protein [Pseudonocardia xinjiangensis]|uniref:EthD domain-containing protein n=1 Tax=Pseudonocardia xinjiangensis TaxID=75289 RepID=UPI003D8A8E40